MPPRPVIQRPGNTPTPEELELLRKRQLGMVKPALATPTLGEMPQVPMEAPPPLTPYAPPQEDIASPLAPRAIMPPLIIPELPSMAQQTQAASPISARPMSNVGAPTGTRLQPKLKAPRPATRVPFLPPPTPPPPPVVGAPVSTPFDFRRDSSQELAQQYMGNVQKQVAQRELMQRAEFARGMQEPYRPAVTGPVKPGTTVRLAEPTRVPLMPDPTQLREPARPGRTVTPEEQSFLTEQFLRDISGGPRVTAVEQQKERQRIAQEQIKAAERAEKAQMPQGLLSRLAGSVIAPGTSAPVAGALLGTDSKALRAIQVANQAVRGLTNTLISSPLKGVGVYSADPVTAEAGIKGAEEIETWMKQRFPKDAGASWLESALPEGVGSALGYGVASLLGGTAGAGALGSMSLSGAMLGALNGAASTYDDAIQKGASQQTAFQAVRVGGLIGMLEGVMGLESRFGRIFKPGPLMERATSIFGEGAEEVVSQFLNNLNAKLLTGYDPDRALSEGLVESGITGLAVASLFEAPGAVGAKLREQFTPTQTTPSEEELRMKAYKSYTGLGRPRAPLVDPLTGGTNKTPDALQEEAAPAISRPPIPATPPTAGPLAKAPEPLPEPPGIEPTEVLEPGEVSRYPELQQQYAKAKALGLPAAPQVSAAQKAMRRPVLTERRPQLPPQPGLPAAPEVGQGELPPGRERELRPGMPAGLLPPVPPAVTEAPRPPSAQPPPPAKTPPMTLAGRTMRPPTPELEVPPMSEAEAREYEFPEGIPQAEPIKRDPALQRKAFVDIGAQIDSSIQNAISTAAQTKQKPNAETIKVKNIKARPDAAIAEVVAYSPVVPDTLIPRYGGETTDLPENSLERVWGGIGRELISITGKPDLTLRDTTNARIVTDDHWRQWAQAYGKRANLTDGEIEALRDTARGGFQEAKGAFLRRDDVRQAMGVAEGMDGSTTAKAVRKRVKAQMARIFGLTAAGYRNFSLTHVPADGWRAWAKLQGLDNGEKYGTEIYNNRRMSKPMAALERAIERSQTWYQREDRQRQIQRKVQPDVDILDLDTPIADWYSGKYPQKVAAEGVRVPPTPAAVSGQRLGAFQSFLKGQAFERQGREGGVTIGRPQGPPSPRRPTGLLSERVEERPVEAAPPTPPVAPKPTPSPTQAPVAPTAPPAASTETRAKKKKKTEGAVLPAPAPAASEVRQGEVGMKLGPGEVVRTLSGRLTTPFPKWKTFSNATATRLTKSVQQWLLANALAEAEARGDEFNARTFRQDLDDLTGSKNLAPQASVDGAEMYLFDWQPPVLPRITKPLVQPTAEPKERTAQPAPTPAAAAKPEAEAAETAPEPTTPQAPPAPSAPEPQGASERVQTILDMLDGLKKGKAEAMRNAYGDEGFRAHFITSKFEAIVEEAEENGKLTKKCP